jgi:hypothetical protein
LELSDRTGPSERYAALTEQNDADVSVEALADEMDRATKRLRADAWMINAVRVSPSLDLQGQSEATAEPLAPQ